MLLSDLSKEAFGDIVFFLQFSDICRLALSCGRLYHIVTSTGVVLNMDMRPVYDARRIPRLAYQLPSIWSANVVVDQPNSRPILPKGVSHPCAFGTGLKWLSVSGSAAMAMLHSLIPIVTSGVVTSYLSAYDLGKTLPHLELLYVTSFEYTALMPPLIESLPPSLTSLRLDPLYSGPLLFPSPKRLINLTRLDLPKCSGFSGATSFSLDQHPALRFIHLPEFDSHFALNSFIENANVPAKLITLGWASNAQNLKSLDVRGYSDHLSELSTLRYLTRLHVTQVTDLERLVTSLPPTLTYFDFDYVGTRPIDPSLFCLLPATLLHFHHTSNVFPEFAVLMTSWERRREETGLALPTWLPPGLKTWHSGYSTRVPREYWALLPPTLTTISPYGCFIPGLLPDEDLDTCLDIALSLPNITTINLGVPYGVVCPRIARNFTFPLCLSTLTLDNITSITLANKLSSLPSTLTSLRVVESVWKLGCITPLPDNLTTFSYQASYARSTIPIADGDPSWKYAQNDFVQSLKHLPPKLRTLSLHLWIYVPCSQHLLTSLPKTLTAQPSAACTS